MVRGDVLSTLHTNIMVCYLWETFYCLNYYLGNWRFRVDMYHIIFSKMVGNRLPVIIFTEKI